MKNLITENYVIWLNRYKNANEQNPKGKLASDLIIRIKNADTLDHLISVFSDYPIPTPDESGHVHGPVNFHEQIAGWKKHLESIQSALPASRSLLEEMLTELKRHSNQSNVAELNTERDAGETIQASDSAKKSASLIRYLLELINLPKAALHIRMFSLLEKTRHPDFSRLIAFLADLDEAPYPTNPRKGEFAAVLPRSGDHKCCLHMLNNLVALNNSSDPLCDLGNGLLQQSLIIDEDLSFEEISLDDEIPSQPNQGWCRLM
ncbi:hypothetical protein ELY21_05635 [Legionella sp. km535]|uniref:hypothetical protein n=1 Tax=Legionella sp. km535 TaxID=2498107 RepID=UPI000F8D3331|nr:hypothetical protein [Legionella sp. km535]RUR19006.1 hypothetical protein ELY21_05635 [Legionella sp. km535]